MPIDSSMSILRIIGDNIRYHRRKLGISQEELGAIAGLDRTYVGSVERGERNVSALNIEKLAKALKIKPERLLQE
jgi:transcriptional regulator with XRE-family HTH domain